MTPPRDTARATAAAALLLLPLGCGGGAAPVDTPVESPGKTHGAAPASLVLIVVDTLRADLGGAIEEVPTPSIDALAAEGVAFPHAFSHAPMTVPAHTALFSAREPHVTGVLANEEDELPDDLPLLAEHLRGLGFATRAAVSLWTLGSSDRGSDLERGFEAYDRSYFGTIAQAPEVDRQLERALDALAGEARPFFLFAHFSDPHFPYNAHEPPAGREVALRLDGELLETFDVSNSVLFDRRIELAPGEHRLELDSEHAFTVHYELERAAGVTVHEGVVAVPGRSPKSWRRVASTVENDTGAPVALRLRMRLAEEPSNAEERARYPREVAFADRYVGELLAELRRRGLFDDALIVLTSDHGEAFGEHGWWGHKEQLYDELLHVPLVIKPPAGAAGEAWDALRRASEGVARHVDVVPTVLELLGLPPLSGQRGTSLLRPGGPREVASATRLMRESAPGVLVVREERFSLRDGELKLIYNRLADCFELYDLRADPGERVNVYARRGGERPEWRTRLLEMASGELATRTVTDDERADMTALGYLGEEAEAVPPCEGY